ncbi:MAG: hypothetical protein ACRDFS_09025, partial [Chloroflexota bacterium]
SVVEAKTNQHSMMSGESTPIAIPVPTVVVPQAGPAVIPTLVIPATPVPKPLKAKHTTHHVSHHPAHRKARHRAHSRPRTPRRQWVVAYLTSYCPGSAGSISASGLPVHFGMLANDFYAFGTHVYMPVLGMTGSVEDRDGDTGGWNHFDVWSAVCYSTPTGYFKVAIQG